MPDAPRPPWTGGSVGRAWAQRADARRVLPPRPPPRRPPPHGAADNGRRGEGARGNAGLEAGGRDERRRGGVADREVAVGASADAAGAGRKTVAADGEAPAPPAREESGGGGRGGGGGGGAGSKRPYAPPAQHLPLPKRMAVSTTTRQFQPASRRTAAAPAPLAGADVDAGSRTRYDGERAENRGSGALVKPAVARPLAVRKDGVGVLSRAVPRNAAPMANTGRQGPMSGTVKSSAARDKGRVAGTDQLWGKKDQRIVTRLPPRSETISATRTSQPGRGKDGGFSSKVHRPLESGRAHGGSAMTEEMLAIDDDSSLADGRAVQIGVAVRTGTSVGSVEKDGKLEKGKAPSKESRGYQVSSNAATRDVCGHTRMVKSKALAHQQRKIASTSVSGSKGKLDDEVASNLKFHDLFRDTSFRGGKLELHFNSSVGLPSVRCQRQYRHMNADARSKFKMSCRMFEFVCRTLLQIMEQRSLNMRIDFLAAEVMKKTLPGFTKHDPIVGQVPGVEVGDEFLYRTQLAIAGLHSKSRAGIDTTYRYGMLIAISIVASGGYPDELDCSGELIYTGSGGKPAGQKKDEDQKLKGGNLALKNCIKTETPVRVIHGFKYQNTERGSHLGAKLVSRYTYDGLYLVVGFRMEGQPGSRVFKYKLKKIPGQPELPMHIAKRLKSYKRRRPGLCMNDICQGKEATPISVINTVNGVQPAPFQYTTRIRYPFRPTEKYQGCDCTNGCSDSVRCACAVKNGGEIPFDLNSAILNEKSVIFECGPSCKCPPSCHNRVSQHEMKIPLEVFRTDKTGWGVRSLRFIPSGSFICEYIGELLHQKEAEKRRNYNNSYLFDVGLNSDENVSSGLLSNVSGLNSSSSYSQTKEDVHFTIDASEYGNIGRFINHSCSPNLQAQNVLWDHEDKRMPHIMFFAAETIPPLQELTYDYNNFEIDRFRGVNRRMKSEVCRCGSSQCRGRFY